MKKGLLFFIFFLISFTSLLNAQQVSTNWVTLSSNGGVPFALAIDGYGNVYTANSNNTVSKFDKYGSLIYQLNLNKQANAIGTDGLGNVYTANSDNTVSKISSSGQITQIWVDKTL